MPGYSGVPVVTMLVCFVLFRTRGCGCIGHPAFPAPSDFSGRTDLAKPRAPRAAGMRRRVSSLRGAKRRSNPVLYAALWIASRSLSSGAHSRDPLARNDGERPEAKNADLPVLLLDKGRKGVDILLQHLLECFLGERALVVEGVADAVQIDLGLTQHRPRDARQDVLQMLGRGNAAERPR